MIKRMTIEHARLLKKNHYSYGYELVFVNEDTQEEMNVSCSVFEYNSVVEGDRGKLVLNDAEIIEFGKRLKLNLE